MNLCFFIECLPPTATAQQKGVMVIGGKPRFFKKKAVRAAESTLWALLMPYAPPAPFAGPVTLVVNLVFPWRKSESKRIRDRFCNMPIQVRPDLSNLVKNIEDVMTTLRFWNDDSQISSLCVHKSYGDHPGIGITLTDSLATTRDGKQEQLGAPK